MAMLDHFKEDDAMINQTASKIRTKIEDLEAQLAKLDSLSAKIQSSWIGEDSAEFLTKVNEKKEELSKYLTSLSDLPQLLEKYTSSMQKQRSEAISKFKRL